MNSLKWHYYRTYIRLKYGIHWHKPLCVLKLVRNIVKAKIYKFLKIKKFVPRGIDLAITLNCNFDCSHCFTKRFKPLPGENKREMTLEDYKRLAEQAIKLGFVVFSFQGGEVFLHKDWEEIIKAFKPNQSHILITTNGSLLNEDLVKRMKNLKVDSICFSLESGIPEEHDKFRRHKGSFEKIMKGMELVKKNGMKIIINATMFHDNLYTEGFKKLLEFSQKNKFLIATILGKPVGNWKGKVDVLMSEEDINYYEQLRKDFPFAMRDNDNNYGECGGCYAVKEGLYMTPFGDVFPCPYTHISLGNVLKEPLEDIRNKGLKVKWYNHYHLVCPSGLDKDFLNAYLPLLEKKGIIPAEEIFEEYR